MKTFMKFVVTILTLLSISFLSQNCTKGPADINNNDKFTEVQNNYKTTPWGIHRSLKYDPIEDYLYCQIPPYNCYDDIVITMNNATYTAYLHLVSSLTNDTIPGFFENCDYDLLFPGLSTQNVNDIIDEKLVLIMRDSQYDLATKLWILLPSEVDIETFEVDDVVYAMPLKLDI